MSGENSLVEEQSKAAPSKRGKIIQTRMPVGPPLSPASKSALRIQKKILSAISAEEERKSKARKRKFRASKVVDGKVLICTISYHIISHQIILYCGRQIKVHYTALCYNILKFSTQYSMSLFTTTIPCHTANLILSAISSGFEIFSLISFFWFNSVLS